MATTSASNNGQRVITISSLRILVTVSKPISGRNRPTLIRPITPASRKAPATSTRQPVGTASLSDFFDIGPAEQTLRQEDQGDRQHRKGGHVLVVDGKVGRPQRLDQADQNAADHGAWQ